MKKRAHKNVALKVLFVNLATTDEFLEKYKCTGWKLRNPGWLYNPFQYQTIAKKLLDDFTSSFEEQMTVSKEQKRRKHPLPLSETVITLISN